MAHADEICPVEASATPGEAAPPHRPWLILTLLFFLTVVLFIARQALSVMAPVLRTVFHLSNLEYGRIVSALGVGSQEATRFLEGLPSVEPFSRHTEKAKEIVQALTHERH